MQFCNYLQKNAAPMILWKDLWILFTLSTATSKKLFNTFQRKDILDHLFILEMRLRYIKELCRRHKLAFFFLFILTFIWINSSRKRSSSPNWQNNQTIPTDNYSKFNWQWRIFRILADCCYIIQQMGIYSIRYFLKLKHWHFS